MVDLSKLKPGDTVHFRCGGSLVVEERKFDSHDLTVEIKFKGYDHYIAYFLNGGQRLCGCFPFDIIRVEPAFRWEDVRPGMAFKYDDPDTGETSDAYFVCITSRGKPCFSIEGFACPQNLCEYVAKNIRRNHEDDIEVAK